MLGGIQTIDNTLSQPHFEARTLSEDFMTWRALTSASNILFALPIGSSGGLAISAAYVRTLFYTTYDAHLARRRKEVQV